MDKKRKTVGRPAKNYTKLQISITTNTYNRLKAISSRKQGETMTDIIESLLLDYLPPEDPAVDVAPVL